MPKGRYDVVFGQGSLVHIADKWGLVAHWRSTLRPGAGSLLKTAASCGFRAHAGNATFSPASNPTGQATLVRPSTWGQSVPKCRPRAHQTRGSLRGAADVLPKSPAADDTSGRQRSAARETQLAGRITAQDAGLVGVFRLVTMASVHGAYLRAATPRCRRLTSRCHVRQTLTRWPRKAE